MRTKVLTLSLVILLSLLPLAMYSGIAAPPIPGPPLLEVDLEAVGEVETDPVEFNHVLATATVTVENFILGTTVHINASTVLGWLVTVTPGTIEVPQGATTKTETISLDIRVPPKASADSIEVLTVYVNASTTIGIEYTDDDSTEIPVKQYYGLRVSTNGTMSLDQGKNLTRRMRVTNTGNGLDDLTVALQNEATLKAHGLEVAYEGSIHKVGKGRTVSIVVAVTADKAAEVGTVDALFRITSDGDITKSDSYRLTITVLESTDNGNGGGNGDGGDGEEESGLGLYIGIGIIVGIVVLIAIVVILQRRMEESDAEDEDYVAGR